MLTTQPRGKGSHRPHTNCDTCQCLYTPSCPPSLMKLVFQSPYIKPMRILEQIFLLFLNVLSNWMDVSSRISAFHSLAWPPLVWWSLPPNLDHFLATSSVVKLTTQSGSLLVQSGSHQEQLPGHLLYGEAYHPVWITSGTIWITSKTTSWTPLVWWSSPPNLDQIKKQPLATSSVMTHSARSGSPQETSSWPPLFRWSLPPNLDNFRYNLDHLR